MITRVADLTCRFVSAFVGILLAVLTVLVGASVFWRYVLNDSITWAQDLSIYLLVYLTLFGAAVGLRRGEMVAFDLVLRRLRPGVARWLWLSGQVTIAIYLVIAIYYGVIVTHMNLGQKSVVLPINMALPYAAVPIGCVLMLLFVVEAIGKGFKPPVDVVVVTGGKAGNGAAVAVAGGRTA